MKKHRSQISRRERRRRQAQSLRQLGARALGLESLESRYALASVPILVDLNPDGASNPAEFTEMNGITYFVATTAAKGRELWKTDGTPQGTSMLIDIQTGAGSSEPTGLVNVGGVLYFAANDGTNGVELWRTDGTVQGTQLVKDIFTGTYTATNYAVIANSSLPLQLTNVGGQLFFTARNGVAGTELWTSDGTAAGTRMVRNIFADNGPMPSSSNPTQLTNYNGQLFFTADDGVNGRELWKSDGSEAGTVLVKDIRTGTYEFTPAGGTASETRPAPSNPGLLRVLNGNLYFVANDGTHGAELWKSDGTTAGTTLVKDIRVGAESPFTTSSVMEVVGNLLMFTANDGVNGDELWKSDGTAAGTSLVKDITPGATGNLSLLAGFEVIDGVLYFAADNTVNGKELWKSDGTAAGTVMVADIWPGTAATSSFPIYMTQVNGTLYFSAFTGTNGRELWQYTAAGGAKLVADIANGVGSFDPNQLTAVNGKLWFSGLVPSGRELFTLVEASQYQLSIYVDGAAVTIPSTIGIKANGATAGSFTSSQGGTINFSGGAGTTLGQFFDIWRTDAGLAGNNTNAILSSTQVLGNVATYDKTVQMFVNGQVVRNFANYQVQAGDDVVIIYGANPVISLNTTYGTILMELYADQKPITVANFLNYVNDGDYLNSLFHRADSDFVIQGGGFTTSSTTYSGSGISQFTQIPADAQIQNEPGVYSNLRGTIAMAKLGGQVNSATNQFFINLSDANKFLDTAEYNAFTVFGKVLSMTTVDKIANLPINTTNDPPFKELPVGADGKLAVVQTITGLGDVTGVRFVDLNSNGVQDSGEEGLAGAVIYVDANNNGVQDSNELFTLTDEDGKYRLQLEPGTHTIRMVVSARGNQTLPTASAAHTVTVEIGSELNNRNFGEAIALTPTGVTLDAVSDTGTSTSDRITSLNNSTNRKLQFEVTGVTPGGEVRLYSGDTLIGSAIATGSTVTIVTNGTAQLADGVHEIYARQTLSGSESPVSVKLSITIDTTAPTPITTTPGSTVALGGTYSYDPASGDEGDADTSYSLLNAPTGMMINPATGAIQWTPTAAQAMTHQFVIRLGDTAGNAALQTVVLTVTGDIAVLPDEYTVAEDAVLTVSAANGVLKNDGTGETLTAEVVDQPENGTLTLNADGSFTYTPDDDFFGVDTFTYKAKNGSIEGNVATVTINVTAVSDPPVGVADNYTTNEDTTLTVPVAQGVLANDSDPDEETLTVTLDTAPESGTLELNPDGSFAYTPASNFNGTVTFKYRVSDGTNVSDPITVTIVVNAVNDPPTAVGDAYTMDEDGTLTVNVAEGVLSNDSDPEGDTMTAELVQNVAHGTLTLNPNGSFTYKPNANYAGTDTFTYRAKDANGQSQTVTVTITINNTNDAPTAVNDTKTVANDGSTHEVDVLANDTDPDADDELTVTAVTQGSNGGTVAISSDGSKVTYKPAAGYTGTETFTYTMKDEAGVTKTATVTMTVTAGASTGVISGIVFFDADNDGVRDTGEIGVPGVLITLTSTSTGTNITRTAITRNDGTYSFTALPAGTYKVTQSQPAALNDGIDKSADADATVTNDVIANIVLSTAETAANNNFGERLLKPEHTSIRWFFASSHASNGYFRQVIAQGEEAAGNDELAAAIRNGDTTFTPSTASAATQAASLMAEEEASNAAADSQEDSLAGLALAALYGAEEDSDANSNVSEPVADESTSGDGSTGDTPLSLHEDEGDTEDLIDAANDSTDGEVDALDAAFAELQSGLAA